MHADEAVQAARFRELWQHGRYVYNPDEYHGPTLAYVTLPIVLLSGAEDFAETTATTYRLVPVLFGIGLVVLFFLFARTLGTLAATMAALFAATSPAMVFYSRYYIHETLLAFFTLAAIACGWRFFATRRILWCLLAGAAVGLMQATKETSAIAYLAAAIASFAIWLDLRRRSAPNLPDKPWSWPHVAAGISVAVLVAITLLSSFFTNVRGPLDAVLTYLPWLSRAAGDSPHIYPWSFYPRRLIWWHIDRGPVWSEGFVIALAACGAVWGSKKKNDREAEYQTVLVRWLVCYTLAITLFYCVIPYKTPWCMLQFLTPMILLAGIGAAALLQWPSSTCMRLIVAALLAAGTGHLGWQAYRASFSLPADVKNPYVFAQTSPDIRRLTTRLRGVALTSEQQWATPVKIIWDDAYYWPLPWYLRRFEHVEPWRSLPSDPAAPVIIAAPRYDAVLTEQLGDDYLMTGYYELRPQVLMQLWVEFDLWESYLKRIGRID